MYYNIIIIMQHVMKAKTMLIRGIIIVVLYSHMEKQGLFCDAVDIKL